MRKIVFFFRNIGSFQLSCGFFFQLSKMLLKQEKLEIWNTLSKSTARFIVHKGLTIYFNRFFVRGTFKMISVNFGYKLSLIFEYLKAMRTSH